MKHIVILYGEPLENAGKDEQDTLTQVEAIGEALRQAGQRVTPVALSLNLRQAADRLRELAPDAVFNLVESVAGQGRLIYFGTALLDALKLPYTGARTEAMFLTSNKLVAKEYLRAAQIPTPEWFRLQDAQDDRRIPRRRYIVKSVWEHASIGLSQASVIETDQAADLRQALELEYRVSFRAQDATDFLEGIRAMIIDKDRNPRWRPGLPAPAEIAALLAPLGPDSLTFTE